MLDNRVLQTTLKAKGLYTATIDGGWGKLSIAAARALAIGTAPKYDPSWPNTRCQLVVEQVTLKEAGLYLDVIDGLEGQNTRSARRAWDATHTVTLPPALTVAVNDNPNGPNTDVAQLAPKFRERLNAAIIECEQRGYPVRINEGMRGPKRQARLYAQGRTLPGPIVTHAATNITTWHGYGLAVDVIHRTLAYWPFGKGPGSAPKNEAWFAEVAAIFKKHGLSWGGDWSKPDTPHIQWGGCAASPTAANKNMKVAHGNEAVWAALGAA